MDCGNEISLHESHENYTTGKQGSVMSRQKMDKIIINSLEYRLWRDNQYPITAINKFTTAIHSIIALYLQIFSCKKFYPFQNVSLGFNLKIFLIFANFSLDILIKYNYSYTRNTFSQKSRGAKRASSENKK